jgi:glycosyltransferase involved in cell wall biosynthesis
MKLAVLLSVYKDEKPDYLHQALTSIWNDQTLKPDQVVLVKDGPLTIELESVVESWQHLLGDTIEIVQLKKNVGLGAALNVGLQSVSSELVARMDTDDIALPDRFEHQVQFMDENLDVVASSGLVEEWDSELVRKLGTRLLPFSSEKLGVYAKRRSPLSHPAAIYRRQEILSVGGYPPLRKAQDYGLWSLLLTKGYKLANVGNVLVRMRAGDDLYSRRNWRQFISEFQLLNYQYRIGFIGSFDYAINISIRAVLRFSPSFVRAFLYRFAR